MTSGGATSGLEGAEPTLAVFYLSKRSLMFLKKIVLLYDLLF
jgi:hypothetical protein